MQIAVIGATGGTGLQVVEQALQRGHFVTAFVRDPAKLKTKHAHLTVLTGDVLESDTLLPAVRRQDAVVCALGSRPGRADKAVSEGTKNLIAAMQETGVRRLLVVSSLGVGESFADASLPSKLFIKTVLSGPIAEKEIQEEAVRKSGLDWLIVRPTRLTNDLPKRSYRVGEQIRFSLFAMPQISRADVATFLLDQLDSNQYRSQAVTITDL